VSVKVRERTTRVKGTPYTYWIVDLGMVDGRRITKQFVTKGEAEQYAAKQTVRLRHLGEKALSLSDDELHDAAHALAALKGSASLLAAAKFYVAHNNPAGGRMPLKDVVEAYVREGESNKLRPRSLLDLKYRLGRIVAHFGGDRLACTITRHDADSWLSSLRLASGDPVSDLSRRHYRTVAGGLFNYAIEHDYVAENPFTSKTGRRRRNGGPTEEKLPQILSESTVEAVIKAAHACEPEMIPALTIGFFAGLRTAEIQRLDWRYVDLEAGLITVPPSIAKKRSVRHVDISENLRAWLLPHKRDSGPVAPQTEGEWRGSIDRVLKRAEVEEWPHNAMRHCFASYHLAKHQDQNKTAMQLGHRDTNLLYNHYRNLVTRQDAEKYWAIAPVISGFQESGREHNTRSSIP